MPYALCPLPSAVLPFIIENRQRVGPVLPFRGVRGARAGAFRKEIIILLCVKNPVMGVSSV